MHASNIYSPTATGSAEKNIKQIKKNQKWRHDWACSQGSLCRPWKRVVRCSSTEGAFRWNDLDQDRRSLGSRCNKGAHESTLGKDLSALLMYHDPSDRGLLQLILIQISPKNRSRSISISACYRIRHEVRIATTATTTTVYLFSLIEHHRCHESGRLLEVVAGKVRGQRQSIQKASRWTIKAPLAFVERWHHVDKKIPKG